MKKILVIFIVLFSIASFSQQQIILISNKYEFQKEPNSYNINNMLKAILVSNNYQVYFEDEVLPLEIAQNKCNALKGVLVDKSNVFLTKVKLFLKVKCFLWMFFDSLLPNSAFHARRVAGGRRLWRRGG